MKTLLLILLAAISTPSFAYSDDAQQKTTVEILKSGLAKSVSVRNGALSIETKDSGSRFLFSVDGSTPRVLKYSEKVTLSNDFEHATFSERHYSITISKKDAASHEYEICEKFDNRSFGGDVVSAAKSFFISDSSLQDVSEQ